MAAAFLIRIPASAARPPATITDIGVASPSAHGHAMTSTEIAPTTPKSGSPNADQTISEMSEMPTTAGTKRPEILSASL